MGTEREPVNESGYHGSVLEEFRPLGEGQIRGDNDAALFVAVGDDLEKQFRLVTVKAKDLYRN